MRLLYICFCVRRDLESRFQQESSAHLFECQVDIEISFNHC